LNPCRAIHASTACATNSGPSEVPEIHPAGEGAEAQAACREREDESQITRPDYVHEALKPPS
jgi:hypothetical protein